MNERLNLPKVLIINGSPRLNGTTFLMLNLIKQELEREDIITTFFQLGGKEIKPCKAYQTCKKSKTCLQGNPLVNELIKKMKESDGIVIGSPTYFYDVPIEVKGVMNLCGLILSTQLERKVGVAVVVPYKGGSIYVYDTINHWFCSNNMFIVGSSHFIDRHINETTKERETENKKMIIRLSKNLSNLLYQLKK
ncbi:hypothetical protein ENUP19_0102G0015 [Entamoeba nuttalli]|uniref:NADPH-dependent FMN reductase domain containing protein n=2 Tax=Entamoeba nuttalli TaxID=412467 RepID=K2G5X0_ENTNP|nr:NADPH-dependent FMN reductase domain containing protein [Entamoeba nuttalli P19]EKE37781.1 NADPH-dependent FMN reductase domain containing protein [Entamoeba nuttalli P19]|eukprot:XP_008859882.1 NADPH-dependent FMN reductase domain containing protein [Entamoeba nuttalli P19]